MRIGTHKGVKKPNPKKNIVTFRVTEEEFDMASDISLELGCTRSEVFRRALKYYNSVYKHLKNE